MLSERKKKILRAVVDENIKKPQAISSRDLKEKYFEDVSSATIRNDLMALEEMGYLFQPHTSAGRFPTPEGFKKYINELMIAQNLSADEVQTLKQNFEQNINGLEDLAQAVAKSISSVTDYASVVYIDKLLSAVVEKVKLVKITDNIALVVVVTDLGVIKDLTITVDETLTDEDLVTASKFITSALGGRELQNLTMEEMTTEITELADKYKTLFSLVVDAIMNREEKPIFKVSGTSNLLSHPEYDNPERARKTLKLFESKEVLAPLIQTGNDVEISIKVAEDEAENCSIVSANYKINGKNVGRTGIVGPLRMDYAKAVSVLKEINSVVAEELNKQLPKPNKGEKK